MEQKKLLVYVSGAYTSPDRTGIDRNIQAARQVAVQLWNEGYAVICPHLNTAHFGDDCAATYDDYIAGDLIMVERSDAVVMLPGYQSSRGAKLEMEHAKQLGIPVYIWPQRPDKSPMRRWQVPTVAEREASQPAQTAAGQGLSLARAIDRMNDLNKAKVPEGIKPGTIVSVPAPVRTFSSGATRDTDQGKLKYEGFFSPAVLERRAQYMHKHRVQGDGSLRDPDNWQKGMPRAWYMDSLIRHTMDLWRSWRNKRFATQGRDAVEDLLCAVMFNAEGLLLEIVQNRDLKEGESDAKAESRDAERILGFRS